MNKDARSDCQRETISHILNVQRFIKIITDRLTKRGVEHDASKLQNPELDIFVKYTPRLAKSAYGSDEYKKFLQEMKPALDHHYMVNRHHPEHFPNGINDMNLIDIVEMLCDWKAATLRHNDGDLLRSIEINQKRFGYDDQIKSIFLNTAPYLYKYQIKWDGFKSKDASNSENNCVSGIVLGDTIDQIHSKIDALDNLNDSQKEMLKFGVLDEFRGKDYTNATYHLDGATITWIIQ